MTERMMNFSQGLVRKIMSGEKTQTRRPIHPSVSIIYEDQIPCHVDMIQHPRFQVHQDEPDFAEHALKCLRSPFGNVGDIILVRETARVIDIRGDGYPLVTNKRCQVRLEYLADSACKWVDYPTRLKPIGIGKCIPNGCFREACRTKLLVNRVWVEQLQDISEESALKEGLSKVSKDGSLFKVGMADLDGLPGNDNTGWPWQQWERDYKQAFRKIWDPIYAKSGKGWDVNPWVWACEFEVMA